MEPYRVVGANGSPYSMKMRAIFRYRRIPHIWQHRSARVEAETANVRPQIVPMVQFPDGSGWRVDSTPIAYELEERHSARSILPEDPAHRFLCALIEDMADEWLTKAMFHYRWFYAPDQDYASWWIATDRNSTVDSTRAAREAFADTFGQRQIDRMEMVGCTAANQPVTEETYRRVLAALESFCGLDAFLFGSRPSLADFGLFGQLKTLGDDPTPRDVMRRDAPTVLHWVRQTDDLSGNEGIWHESGDTLASGVQDLLNLCGEAYLPFLQANLAALESGAEEVALEIWDRPFRQPAFRYQGKCYLRLRSMFAGLPEDVKETISRQLENAGGLKFLL